MLYLHKKFEYLPGFASTQLSRRTNLFLLEFIDLQTYFYVSVHDDDVEHWKS